MTHNVKARLTDLAPHWVQPAQWSDEASPFYVGVSFLCPHCEHTKCPTCGAQRGRRLAVNFWPPIDPGDLEKRITEIPHNKFHQRLGGETFDKLTLAPSVRIEGHWHGNIIDGQLIDAPN